MPRHAAGAFGVTVVTFVVFHFGAELRDMGLKAAAGERFRLLDVKHFGKQDVFQGVPDAPKRGTI